MGLNPHTYIGPYVRCEDNTTGEPDNWVTERFDDERLFYGNGEGFRSPAVFLPNVSYNGEIEELAVNNDWSGEVAFMVDCEESVRKFAKAFWKEIKVLEECFSKVEVVFGKVSTYW